MASSGASTGIRGSTNRGFPTPGDECRCGSKIRLLTSWTADNPGRRFWACGQRVGGCGFIDWFDLEMCDRAKHLISDLKNKVTRLEVELQVCNAQISQLDEELRVERSKKPFLKDHSQVKMPAVMFGVVFVAVFVAVFMAKYLII